MHRQPHSWTNLLAKLGFTRKKRKNVNQRSSLTRHLQVEPLEDRRMLAVFSVTSNQDNTIAGDGLTTLREAIVAANLLDDADTINFASGLNNAIITLNQGTALTIVNPVTINGADANGVSRNITVSAAGNDTIPGFGNGGGTSVFAINLSGLGKSVTLDSLTITRGDPVSGGGVNATLNNFAALNLLRSTLNQNGASLLGGGLNTYLSNHSSLQI